MILNVPLKGQLLDTTEVNRYWDCVPTCIASALQFLTGQPFDGGQIKDIVYGAAYVGGTAAAKYIDYCARFGVQLTAINGDGNGSTLVNASLSQLAKGNPVLYTEPDPYDDPSLYSHVVLACGYDATRVYVMDPYIDRVITKSQAEWARILEFNQVWAFSRNGMENSMFTEASSDFHNYYTLIDAEHWKSKNGYVVQLGMKAFYQTLSRDGQTLPILGLPTSNEMPAVIRGKKITVQRWERGDTAYDPGHLVDSQPGCSNVYVLKRGELPLQ